MSTDHETEPITEQAALDTPSVHATDGKIQPLQESTKKELIAALQQNWQREVEGVRTYRDLAAQERDPARQTYC